MVKRDSQEHRLNYNQNQKIDHSFTPFQKPLSMSSLIQGTNIQEVHLGIIQNSSHLVISLSDQFQWLIQQRKNINHLLKSKMIFPRGKHSLPSYDHIRELNVSLSCPVYAVIAENSLECKERQKEVIIEGGGLLQLREGHLALYDHLSQQILDSCPCSLDLTFSLHEGPQIPISSGESFTETPPTFSMLRLTHKDAAQSCVAFLVRAQDKKTLEYFGIGLEKCVILQKDFHRKFKPLRKLGKGASAAVYSALRLKDSAMVAVKAFNKSAHFSSSAGKGKAAFEKEVRSLAECSHHNLCGYSGVFETDNSLYVVMQAYDRSLSALLRTHQTLPRAMVVGLLEQLLRGVAHLHAKGFMHRDIKLENIMLKQTEAGLRAIIIDMGMAEQYDQPTYLFEHCGTPGFAAPEIFGPRPPHPQKCDVFSLGVVFHMLLFKKAVFSGNSCAEVCENNRAGKMTLATEELGEEDDLLRDLLLRMLDLDNLTRISAGQALEHQIFNASSVKTPILTSAETDAEPCRTLSLEEI